MHERLLLGGLLLAGTASAKQAAAQTPPADNAQRPNVVFILADDLGYGDLSCYGQQRFRTPHIDSLAARGMQLHATRARP